MGQTTEIAWTDHTFNPWWGCTKVSPGCDHCYAETFSKRVGLAIWGNDADRRFFGAKHWQEPVKWNKAAEKAGTRARVFCSSMADVFEGLPEQREHRLRLYQTIIDTPSLDWLLLTKRPGAIRKILERDLVEADNKLAVWILDWLKGRAPANVWLGTTVEDQERADSRIKLLEEMPAVVRFLSMEPLLEHVSIEHATGIDWIIVGGESGGGARVFDASWAISLLEQSKKIGAAFFMKQLGKKPMLTTIVPPASSSMRTAGGVLTVSRGTVEMTRTLPITDAKGGVLEEWPAAIRVRDFPTPRL